MISLILVLCCLGGQALAAPRVYALDDAEAHFEQFMKLHGKEYSSEAEKNVRFEIFKKNLISINEDNLRYNSSAFGINLFTDMEPEEFLLKHTGFESQPLSSTQNRLACNLIKRNSTSLFSIDPINLPKSFDWRRHYVVTRVKDQGQCGTCYSFSTTGNIEGQFARKHGFRVELSEQQIIDCSPYSQGCHGGGRPDTSMRYLIDHGGIMTEEQCPYLEDDNKCIFSPDEAFVKVTGCDAYVFGSEDDLKETLYEVGPLSVGLDAMSLLRYDSGILPYCISNNLNHAVLLVGYGTDPITGELYWTFKNSWGLNFGEAGYFRLRRNENSCMMMEDVIVSAHVA